MEEQTHNTDVANEAGWTMQTRNSVDGLLAYIMSVSPSVTTRKLLGKRLIEEADKETDRLKYKVENQIREMGAIRNWQDKEYVKPSGYAIRNAVHIIECSPSAVFLEKVSPYPTDHATIMLKWIVGDIVASVDASRSKFTYAIINTATVEGMSGEGTFKGNQDIEEFYHHFQAATL